MTRRELVDSIRHVLEVKMGLPHVPEQCESARLHEELRLDSVLVLQLLLHLELDMGVTVPEEALSREHLITIGSLVDFLIGASGRS